jgi:hypothetical protein
MKVVLKYLLIVFVFISYFQSALEFNNEHISNTFNDEYDTYIHSENFASQALIKTDYQSGIALLPETVFYSDSPETTYHFTSFADKANIPPEQRLFLKNRSLLI